MARIQRRQIEAQYKKLIKADEAAMKWALAGNREKWDKARGKACKIELCVYYPAKAWIQQIRDEKGGK